MQQFVGLDVSQEMTDLCVIDSDSKIIWQGKCLRTPEDIADKIKSKASDVARIGLESGPLARAPSQPICRSSNRPTSIC